MIYGSFHQHDDRLCLPQQRDSAEREDRLSDSAFRVGGMLFGSTMSPLLNEPSFLRHDRPRLQTGLRGRRRIRAGTCGANVDTTRVINRMKQLFAVIRSRGAAWRASRSKEGQEDWEAHASFMNALEKEGFVVLGGPLEGTPDVLLVVRARTPDEVVDRLSADPWAPRAFAVALFDEELPFNAAFESRNVFRIVVVQ